jgi:hypothetical protein
MTWRDMAPDMLVTLAPMLAGIVMLVMDFDALYLSAIILMVLLATAGNGLVRGRLTCAFCRQRELGCPAERLFSKK